jgi:hypothetical protein
MADSETGDRPPDQRREWLGLSKVRCKQHRRHKNPPLHWRARWVDDDGKREHDTCFGPNYQKAKARLQAIQTEWFLREIKEVIDGTDHDSEKEGSGDPAGARQESQTLP